MKFNTIVCAVAAASFGFSALAFGADYDQRNQRDQRDNQQRGQRYDARQNDQQDQHRDRREDFQGERRNDRHSYYNARGPEFRRGAPIPYEFRRSPYVVVDYRAHRLAPPPRGQHWVQVGPDYALIAIATGLIASIVLGN